MGGEKSARWFILRFQARRGDVWVGFETARGQRREPRAGGDGAWQTSPRPESVPITGLSGQMHLPAELNGLLEEAVSSLPKATAEARLDPARLALFVEAPADLWEEPWETLALSIVPEAIRDRVQPVRMPATGPAGLERAPASRLQSMLVCGTAAEALTETLRKGLEKSAAAGIAPPDALRVERVELSGLQNRLLGQSWDVMVLDRRAFQAFMVLGSRRTFPVPRRPRLVILLDPPGALEAAWPSPPPGMALLWLPLADPAAGRVLFHRFILALSQRHALHEALSFARSDGTAARAGRALLVATPPTLDLFRRIRYQPRQDVEKILEVFRKSVKNSGGGFSRVIAPGEVKVGPPRLLNRAPGRITLTDIGVRSPGRQSVRGRPKMASIEVDLGAGERWRGGETLSIPQMTFSTSGPTVQPADARGAGSSSPPPPRPSSRPRKPRAESDRSRRVNITLHRERADGRTPAVRRDETLARGVEYQLVLQIGPMSRQSLLTEPPPPIDPLLPPAAVDGHWLEVVVYEKDFTLLEKTRLQMLHLPKEGSSRPVPFRLRAPSTPGTARLRVVVYHRSHLVQSYLLEAQVGTGRRKGARAGVAINVQLEVSRSARFTNLEALPPRALSMSVNDSGGTHTFMLKTGAQAVQLDLPEKLLEQEVHRFRKTLHEATFLPDGKARFSTVASGAPPSADFHEVVRQLADQGRELHQLLFKLQPTELQASLKQIAASHGETLQFVRHAIQFAFPWSILYDFKLPPKVVGATLPPVCLGIDAGAKIEEWPARRCAHTRSDKVYCLNGFWGIRHHIEELLVFQSRKDKSPQDAIDAVPAPATGAVGLALEESDDAFAKQLRVDLSQALGSAVADLPVQSDLVELLWDDQKRPALLVVFGHLETRQIPQEPVGMRIVLVPRKRWLTPEPITDLAQDATWSVPRSIVMLMACGTAATELSTLTDFASAFSCAGATAVVGTECPAFSRLLQRFAHDLSIRLWEGQPLGVAMTGFRRRLAVEGNPLGFIFSALGSADARLVR